MLRNRAKFQLKDYSSGAKTGVCMLKAKLSFLHSLSLDFNLVLILFFHFLFLSFFYLLFDRHINYRGKSSLILPRKLFFSSCFFHFQVGSRLSLTLHDLNLHFFWWLTKVQSLPQHYLNAWLTHESACLRETLPVSFT